MSDLRDLYQEVILDHSRGPLNFRVPETSTNHAEGYNPLCGDRFTVYVTVEGGVIRDAAFQGTGCAISRASASMMTEAVKGRTRAEAETLFQGFHDLVTGQGGAPDASGPLGKLAVFAGVGEFPARVKCATLAWHTLRAALESRPEAISTE